MSKKEVDKSYLDHGLPEPLSVEEKPQPKIGAGTMLFLIIISVLFGAGGGVGGLLYLQRTGTLGELPIPTTTTEKLTLEESSVFIDATDKVKPAVVSIAFTSRVRDFFGRFYASEGAGTGFIVTNDGFIVTNKHVIKDDAAEYTVFTADGQGYPARVIAKDPLNDLAVIKIEAKGLPVVDLGNSDDLRIGQWVIAIGNALGKFQNTVTVGVVSAKERSLRFSQTETLEGLLQTDAAINEGNSGGPLVNTKGQVVGINTAVVAGQAGAEGLGFAIPINSVKSVIDQAVKTGKIARPFLGVRYVPITKDIKESADLPVDTGVWLYGDGAVVADSPAAKAGLQSNDIVSEVDGKPINENRSLVRILQDYKPGDTVTLTVLRGSENLKIPVTLGETK